MNLIDNWITTHKYAKEIAVIAYLLGMVLLGIGYLLSADWSVYLMILGLIIWGIPVMWAGHMFAHGK